MNWLGVKRDRFGNKIEKKSIRDRYRIPGRKNVFEKFQNRIAKCVVLL
jgi:hypothetical protein